MKEKLQPSGRSRELPIWRGQEPELHHQLRIPLLTPEDDAFSKTLDFNCLPELQDTKSTRFIDLLNILYSSLLRCDESWFEDPSKFTSIEHIR